MANKLKTFSKPAEYLILIILPVILFLSSYKTIVERDKVWYAGGYDPEYAYLFNSLNIATFRLVGHFDHPGTPMQVFGATVLWGKWLINQKSVSLTEDVISNPEEYLRALNVATAGLSTLAVFLAGLFLLLRTRNIWYALLLQATPFISGFILYNAFSRVTQEATLMAASLFLAAVLVDWLINQKHKDELSFAKTFGIISGFGLASKILFAPLLVIPVLILSDFKSRKRFFLFTISSFIVFTIPIIILYPNMAWWIIKLLIFSGQYGSGEMGLLDTLSYPQHLKWIMLANTRLAVVFTILLIILLLKLIYYKSIKKIYLNKSAKVIAAIFFAILAGYLMIAKQPKESYLLPYEMLTGAAVILMLNEILNLKVIQPYRIIILPVIVVLITFLNINAGLSSKESIYSSDKNSLWQTSWLAMTNAPGKNVLIFAHPASSPSAALFFGNAYSHWRYSEKIKLLSPNTFIFSLAELNIINWDRTPVNPSTLIGSEIDRILYQGPVETRAEAEDFFKSHGFAVQQAPYYEDEKQLILLVNQRTNTLADRNTQLIFSSAENTYTYDFLSFPDKGFKSPGKTSPDISHSGHQSIFTNRESPYAFTSKDLSLKPGDELSASVYALGNQNSLKIIVSESVSTKVLVTSDTIPKYKAGWNKHNVNYRNTSDSTINVFIYCLNHSAQEGWFDDFLIETSIVLSERQ
jgi:hypothetical protein